MFRYVVFIWNEQVATQVQAVEQVMLRMQRTATQWHCALRLSGLRVYHTTKSCSSARVHPLHANAGVVLGSLFSRRNDSGRVALDVMDEGATDRIVASGGRELVEEYWGDYIAVLRESNRRQTIVLRGPMSKLPCYHVSCQEFEIFFSSMGDCEQLDLGHFSINWDFVTKHLIYPTPTQQTGLRGSRVPVSRVSRVLDRKSTLLTARKEA